MTQQTYDAFRDAVFTKHRKLRGSLQDEADAALLAFLPSLQKPNPNSKPTTAPGKGQGQEPNPG